MEGGREVRERERVEGRRGWREGDFEKEVSGRGERECYEIVCIERVCTHTHARTHAHTHIHTHTHTHRTLTR